MCFFVSLLRNFAAFSIFTFISRIFGFIRDMLIAYKLGAGHYADIFFVAFRLPNVFRSLFAEGAFSSAFIPIYSKNKDSDFVNKIYTVMLCTLLFFCVFMQIVMPFFVYLVASGFVSDVNKFDMTVSLSRIMFPYLITISLVSLLSGVLQAHKHFLAAATVPIILNLCMIFGLVCLTQYVHVLYALAFSVVVAGFLQLLLLLSAVTRNGQTVRFAKFSLDQNSKEFFRRLLPVVFGAGIIQISALVDTFFASTIPGAVSYLYYADRIAQLPLALIGISLGNVLLPLLSDYAAKSDVSKIIEVQNRAIKIGLTLCIPSAAALYMFSETAITCFFAYGTFSSEAVEKTSKALKAFATALPAFVLYKILINNYFSRGDAKTTVIVSLFSLMVNMLLNLILIGFYQHVGIVIATSISTWISVIILTVKLRIDKYFKLDNSLDKSFVTILLSTALMLIIAQFVELILNPLIFFGTIPLKLFTISAMAAFGIGSYFTSIYLISKIFHKRKTQ